MRVSQLQLEKGHFVPGLFELKRTLNQQHYPGIDMFVGDVGVVCTFKGITFIIPFSKCDIIVINTDDRESDVKAA